eukprot:8417723-Pyramimonas_sp.AAC.1
MDVAKLLRPGLLAEARAQTCGPAGFDWGVCLARLLRLGVLGGCRDFLVGQVSSCGIGVIFA